MPYILLLLSIVLSTGRNILSKSLSATEFGTKAFFKHQSILFAFGSLILILFADPSALIPSPKTLLLSAIYSVLLLFAQWFYTIALGSGNTATCSAVYSMGFILPIIFGALIWSEPFSQIDLAGVICAVLAIIYSKKAQQGNQNSDKRYLLSLLIATISSGGLGIMQKIQQSSDVADEKAVFLCCAFVLASVISFIASLITHAAQKNTGKHSIKISAGIGIAFGSCNLLNTILAGLLASSVLFPTLNIGVIILTMLCGMIFFKERISKKDLFVLLLGGMAILLLNIP